MRLRRQCKYHYAGGRSAVHSQPRVRFSLVQECAYLATDLDTNAPFGIMQITDHTRCRLAETPRDEKMAALRRHHAVNPRPHVVRDAAFNSGNTFFDARDVVQVKYEMLRRVRQEGEPVSHAAASFGFSRPAFYEAQSDFDADGLPGLMPQRPGPKRAHKLSEEVVDRLEQALQTNPSLNSAQLAQWLEDEFGLRVHRRSVERALDRRRKKAGSRR